MKDEILKEIVNDLLIWAIFVTAVKCNDNVHVLRTLAGLGSGFDCASKVITGT